MICHNCQYKTIERRKTLKYTVLDKMVSLHLINCTHHYCPRCDNIYFSDEVSQFIKGKLETAQRNSRIKLKF